MSVRGSASSCVEKAQPGGRLAGVCVQRDPAAEQNRFNLEGGSSLGRLLPAPCGETKINKYHVLWEEYGVRGSAWTGVKISKGGGRSHWLSSWSDSCLMTCFMLRLELALVNTCVFMGEEGGRSQFPTAPTVEGNDQIPISSFLIRKIMAFWTMW